MLFSSLILITVGALGMGVFAPHHIMQARAIRVRRSWYSIKTRGNWQP
jgi:hypothetical protein